MIISYRHGLGCLMLVYTIVSGGAYAAQSADAKLKQEEDRISKQEEEAEGKLGLSEKKNFVVTGTLNLYDEEKLAKSDGVFGTLDSTQGATYLVKLDSSVSLAQLKKYDTKNVSVSGKSRVKGKYLVITGIVELIPGPERKEPTKRGGI